MCARTTGSKAWGGRTHAFRCVPSATMHENGLPCKRTDECNSGLCIQDCPLHETLADGCATKTGVCVAFGNEINRMRDFSRST